MIINIIIKTILIILIILFLIIIIVFISLKITSGNNNKNIFKEYEENLLNNNFEFYSFPAYYVNKSNNADYKELYNNILKYSTSSSTTSNWWYHDIAYPRILSWTIVRMNYKNCNDIFEMLEKYANKIKTPWKRFAVSDNFTETYSNLWDKMLWYTIYWNYCKKNNIAYDTTIEQEVKKYFKTPLKQTSYKILNVIEGFYDDGSFIFHSNVPLKNTYLTSSLKTLYTLSVFYDFHDSFFENIISIIYINGYYFKDIHDMGRSVSRKDINLGAIEIIQIYAKYLKNHNKPFIIEAPKTCIDYFKLKFNDIKNILDALYPYFSYWYEIKDFKWKQINELDIINSRTSNFKFYRNEHLLQITSKNKSIQFEYGNSGDDLRSTSGGTQQDYVYYGGYLTESYSSFNNKNIKPLFSNQLVNTYLPNTEQTYYKFNDKNIIILKCTGLEHITSIFYDVKYQTLYFNNLVSFNEEFCVFSLYTKDNIIVNKIDDYKYQINNIYYIESSEKINIKENNKLTDCYIDGIENQTINYIWLTTASRPIKYKVSWNGINNSKSFDNILFYKQKKNISDPPDDKKNASLSNKTLIGNDNDIYIKTNDIFSPDSNTDLSYYGPYALKYNNSQTIILYGSILNSTDSYDNIKYIENVGQKYIIYNKSLDDTWEQAFSL